MSLEYLNFDTLLNDSQAWPKCPSCQSQMILMGGPFSCCAECSFLGLADDLEKTELLQFARARLSARETGERGVLSFQFGDMSEEKQKLFLERSSRLGQLLHHHPILVQGLQTLKANGRITPVAIWNDRSEESPHEMRAIHMVPDFKQLVELSATKDVSSLLYEAPADMLFRIGYQGGHGKNFLVLQTHIYGSPSVIQAYRFYREFGEIRQVEFIPNIPHRSTSPIWQPIDWSMVRFEENIKPAYLAVYEDAEQNITWCVNENLDGAPVVEASYRKPWQVAPSRIETFPFSTTEHAVAGIKENFYLAQRYPKGETVVAQEFAWDVLAHPTLILNEIRTAEFWKDYAKIRDQK